MCRHFTRDDPYNTRYRVWYVTYADTYPSVAHIRACIRDGGTR